MDPKQPQASGLLKRKATIEAVTRAVRLYWENEKARPVPDHLSELAAKADEAVATHFQGFPKPSDTSAPENSADKSRQITQVKARDI
jgi:hypothetical protein